MFPCVLSLHSQKLHEFISSIVRLAKCALVSSREDKEAELYEENPSEEEVKPLLMHHKRFMDPQTFVFDKLYHEVPPHLFERAASTDARNWMEEFQHVNLPGFSVQYMQLVHVPLDVMRECLRMQVELGNQTPSSHTVKQVSSSWERLQRTCGWGE